MKPAHLTKHARDRMTDPERGVVTEEEVLAVLANPRVSYTGVDGKSNVLGESGGNRIRVCFVDGPDRLTIATVIKRGRV